jgi:hypothetical protein
MLLEAQFPNCTFDYRHANDGINKLSQQADDYASREALGSFGGLTLALDEYQTDQGFKVETGALLSTTGVRVPLGSYESKDNLLAVDYYNIIFPHFMDLAKARFPDSSIICITTDNAATVLNARAKFVHDENLRRKQAAEAHACATNTDYVRPVPHQFNRAAAQFLALVAHVYAPLHEWVISLRARNRNWLKKKKLPLRIGAITRWVSTYKELVDVQAIINHVFLTNRFDPDVTELGLQLDREVIDSVPYLTRIIGSVKDAVNTSQGDCTSIFKVIDAYDSLCAKLHETSAADFTYGYHRWVTETMLQLVHDHRFESSPTNDSDIGTYMTICRFLHLGLEKPSLSDLTTAVRLYLDPRPPRCLPGDERESARSSRARRDHRPSVLPGSINTLITHLWESREL